MATTEEPGAVARSHPALVAVAGACAAAWVGWMLVGPSTLFTKLVSDVGLMLSAYGASVAFWWRANHVGGPVDVSWRLFALACLSWGAGQSAWTGYHLFGVERPAVSGADAGYLLFIPLATAALVLLAIRVGNVRSGVRSLVDGLVIALSLLFLSWGTALGDLYANRDVDPLAYVVGLAYPIGDVVMITVVLLILAAGRQHPLLSGRVLILIAAGLVGLAVADAIFAIEHPTDAYQTGDATDVGWFLGFGLLALAAVQPVDGTGERPSHDVGHTPGFLAPYVAVGAAFALACHRMIWGDGLGTFLDWTGMALIVLILIRQFLTLSENLSLTRDLEHRVAERTAELNHSERRFRSLVHHSSDMITVVDPAGAIRYQSGSDRVLGYDGSLEGSNLLDLVHPSDHPRMQEMLAELALRPAATRVVEFALLASDGSWRQTETTVTNMSGEPSVEGLVLNTRDVSERKSLERELLHSAFHDSLTQLANRRLFSDRLQHALIAGRRHHRPIAVLFLDLDGFKAVNDSFGHEAGDAVLVEVANRLRECVREADTVSRLGGDEFAILLEDLAGASEVNAVAERLCETLRSPFRVDHREVFLGGSVGIAASETGLEVADELLRNADLAMYQAKSERSGGYRWYEPSMHRAVVQRLETDNDLRRALERGELYLQYQPIVELASGRIIGAEALLRWAHPTRGLVGPSEFIPAAERNGLVVPIGEWVMDEACQQLRRWHDSHGDRSLSMSINLSGRQLHQSDVAGAVSAALDRCGVAPDRVVLEMTESVLVDHGDEALEHLDSLKRLGVRLAVDDFGTGYSALSYLHRLPVDVIKIDKFFVDGLTVERAETSLAGSIVSMGAGLKLVTVAEGVEDRHQLEVLRRLGCDLAQGYLLSRPVCPSAFDDLLVRNRSDLAVGHADQVLDLTS